MSIEERAEQYADEIAVKNSMPANSEVIQFVKRAYIKGRADESINAVEQMNSRIKELHSDLTHKGYAVIQWHKVADGDLPKEFYKPYLCRVSSHFEVGYFTAYKEQPWHFDEYYLDNEDVIAWKEIVLPKESEVEK